MKVEKKEKDTLIKDTQGNLFSFIEKLAAAHTTFKDDNLIIDISVYTDLKLKDILAFLALSNTHRKGRKSFVIVVSDFDFDEVPEEMIVVPTVLEAHDIIEMEEIERDLGF